MSKTSENYQPRQKAPLSVSRPEGSEPTEQGCLIAGNILI